MNVNQVDKFGNTQIMDSILNEKADNNTKMDTIQLLINYGADLEIKNKDGKTALMLASELNNYEIVEFLLSLGAKPNAGGLKTTTKLSTEQMRLLRKFNETYELYPGKLGDEIKKLDEYSEKLQKNIASIVETPIQIKKIAIRLSEMTEINHKELNDELEELTKKFHSDFELMKRDYEGEMKQVERIYEKINESINALKLEIDKFKPTDGRSLRRSSRKSRSRKNKMKIAIIGSGISGLYTAYRLKKKYHMTNSQIDIYEKNKIIGGRVKTIKFDNETVVAGAGIGRLKKDHRLFQLCKELKVKTNKYTSKISYTFQQLNILDVIEFLKTKLNKNIMDRRHLITFKQFAEKILGKDIYDLFIKSVGFTDFENEDVIDVIFEYGFDDCVSGNELFSIDWNQFLEALGKKLRSCIKLNTPVNKITKTNNGKFIVNDNVYDKVFIATDSKTAYNLTGDNIYKSIKPQTFTRLYVKLNKPIGDYNRMIFTEKPFQKIIEMNKDKCIYMISYSDNKIADKWLKVDDINLCVEKNIRKIFGVDAKVLKRKLVYWKTGTHYFSPLQKEYRNRNEFISDAQNPETNIYVVGEAYSNSQGWCEGALESVEMIL
jgi:hypothetical protein